MKFFVAALLALGFVSGFVCPRRTTPQARTRQVGQSCEGSCNGCGLCAPGLVCQKHNSAQWMSSHWSSILGAGSPCGKCVRQATSSNPGTETRGQAHEHLIGGAEGAHGCIPGAGYSWCGTVPNGRLQADGTAMYGKCVRIWMLPNRRCPATIQHSGSGSGHTKPNTHPSHTGPGPATYRQVQCQRRDCMMMIEPNPGCDACQCPQQVGYQMHGQLRITCNAPTHHETHHQTHHVTHCQRLAATHQTHNSGGYHPACGADGDFEGEQCNSPYCFCVDPMTGDYIQGTEVRTHNRASLDCQQGMHYPGVRTPPHPPRWRGTNGQPLYRPPHNDGRIQLADCSKGPC